MEAKTHTKSLIFSQNAEGKTTFAQAGGNYVAKEGEVVERFEDIAEVRQFLAIGDGKMFSIADGKVVIVDKVLTIEEAKAQAIADAESFQKTCTVNGVATWIPYALRDKLYGLIARATRLDGSITVLVPDMKGEPLFTLEGASPEVMLGLLDAVASYSDAVFLAIEKLKLAMLSVESIEDIPTPNFPEPLELTI